jgi:hypothetical protein
VAIDDAGVDGERLVHAVEAEHLRALQVGRRRQALLAGDDVAGLVTPGHAGRDLIRVEPTHERLEHHPLEADRRRRHLVGWRKVGQALTS